MSIYTSLSTLSAMKKNPELSTSLAFYTLFTSFTLDHLKQFEIRKRGEVTTLGQPYDFQSIMHYSNKEFSKNGADTIQAIADPGMPLGNVNSLSAVDVMQLNLLYNCPEALKQGSTHRHAMRADRAKSGKIRKYI